MTADHQGRGRLTAVHSYSNPYQYAGADSAASGNRDGNGNGNADVNLNTDTNTSASANGNVSIECIHGRAESLPLPDGAFSAGRAPRLL
ncbi:hypothetical protein GS429_21005 [Natronorubrum sp. JWXQ-INN-674]|uniref:Uncharacterized protein n=1 Tax=Natronorubrum halalkaliphilum TaxID=2691917 RepID=A0A6B0VSW6_9EURY|nr:hypothetical protein [Natronorubrum halalkaliphilum]MXV64504.1 hypothetical protein [Natronorubrum halalkaliphilum]